MNSRHIIEIDANINFKKILSVAQECSYGEFTLPETAKKLKTACKLPEIFVRF
jgi:hypothetical protein